MEKNWLEKTWWVLLVRGIFAIVFGIMAAVWPAITAVALVVLWGIWALVDGIAALAAAFAKGATGKGWLIFFGVVSVLAGLVALIHPFDVAQTLTWILGIWFIVTAVFQAIGAFSSTRTQPRWVLLVSAALSLLIGILFVANPGGAVLSIVLWVGVLAVIWGIILVVAAFFARNLGHELDAAAAEPAT